MTEDERHEATTEALAVAAASITAPVFEREGWRYGGGEGYVPTEGELALTVARLLTRKDASTGRFYVTTDEDGDVYVYLQLGCILGGEVDVS